MWPYLFGPGWIWDVLVSTGFFALIGAGVAAGAAAGRRPRRQAMGLGQASRAAVH
jgi:hypothetical protein